MMSSQWSRIVHIKALDNGFEARAITLDMSKALDKLFHKWILFKLFES